MEAIVEQLPSKDSEEALQRKVLLAEVNKADVFGMVCTLVSCGIAGYQIIQHLRYYSQPAIQLQIIRILSMIPVCADSTHSEPFTNLLLLGVPNGDLAVYFPS